MLLSRQYILIVSLLLIFIFSIIDNCIIYANKIEHLNDYIFHNKFTRNKIILLTVFTSNIYEQVMNFYITSIKKLNISNSIFLSLDISGYNLVKNILPNVYMSLSNVNVSQHIDYNTPLYWKVVYSKTLYVKMFIEKKFSVILCDTDVIFFKDPRGYMLKYDTDLVTTCDHKCPIMNSGL